MTSPDSAATVITATPVRPPWKQLVLLEVGFLPVAGVVGYFFDWWLGVLMVLACVVPLFVTRTRNRATANQPHRIEISADRIVTVSPRGHGNQLTRADGPLLAVRKLGEEPHVYVVGPGGDNGSVSLARFGIDAVGHAALAHGWQWQPLDSTAPIMPEAAPEPASVHVTFHQPTEIQLRDGRTQTVPSKPTLTALILVAMVAVCSLVGVLSTANLPDVAFPLVIAGGAVLLAGLVLGGAFWLLRRSRATVTVDPNQVSVKYGSLSASVVQRSAIAAGDVGERWVRLRDHRGKHLIWVPLRPKREEVLSALRWHGWPVT